MTTLLTDISSFQHGLRIADLTDCVGVLAKCTEGTYYADADYDGWRQQAKAAGKLFVPYHFISGEAPAAQAAALAAHIGDPSLPVMLDFEPEGTYKPPLAQLLAVADAINAKGMRTRLAYLPRWYWAQLGGPDLGGLISRRLGLISSAYPGGSGTGAQLYPGDGAAGWQPYGGMGPLIYQFTDKASDDGQLLDMNAYRGTPVALAAFLGSTVPTPTTGGTTMGTYTMSAGWQNDYPDVAGPLQAHIPAGTVVDEAQAAGYAMVRSFVSAERLLAVEGKLDAVNAKLDELLARPASQGAGGADPAVVADDVVHELGAKLSAS